MPRSSTFRAYAVAPGPAAGILFAKRRPQLLLALIRPGTQHPGQRPRGCLWVFDLVRRSDDARGLEARRELPAVDADDAAAGRWRGRHLSPVLLGGEGLVPLVVDEADVHGPPSEEEARHREHGGHHPQSPVSHGPTFAAGRRAARTPGASPAGEGCDPGTGGLAFAGPGAEGCFCAAGVLDVSGPGPVNAAVVPLPLLSSSVSHPPLLSRRIANLR